MSNQFQQIRLFDQTTFAFKLDRLLRTINPSDPAETVGGSTTLIADPALQIVGTPTLTATEVHYVLKVSSSGKVRKNPYPVRCQLVTSSGLKLELDPMWFTVVG